MDKVQRDLIASCWNHRMSADYQVIQGYASRFKKYNNMRIRDIDEVVEKLRELYLTGKKK